MPELNENNFGEAIEIVDLCSEAKSESSKTLDLASEVHSVLDGVANLTCFLQRELALVESFVIKQGLYEEYKQWKEKKLSAIKQEVKNLEKES